MTEKRSTDEETGAETGRLLPALGAAASISVIFIAVLSIPLEAAETLGLTNGETEAWIIAVWGVPGALSLVLAFVHRQPLLFTGNIFILILIVRLGTEHGWAELIGSTMVAGAVVLVLGPLGLTDWLADWLPAPVVFGLLAGAVLPFLMEMFGYLGDEPVLVGGTLVVFLASRRFLEPRVPAILPALVAAVALGAITGAFSGASVHWSIPAPELTAPAFSLGAIASVTPVMVVFITVQANVPSIVFLREQRYETPERTINGMSGLGSVLGSILGPTGVSLSLPATALVAGPDAGPHSSRHWSVYLASGTLIAIAFLAGLAVELASIVPRALLLTAVGLAVLGILSLALQRATEGPLIWGPLFALIIALSDFELFGLGEFFWAIAGGVIVSALLEWDEWKEIRESS